MDRERVRPAQRVPQPLPGRGHDRGSGSRSRSAPTTTTTAASSSTRTSSPTSNSSTSSRPEAAPTGRTTRPPSNPATNHVVRKHAFYYRYELAELDLLNELWQLVSVKVNLFTPSKKPVGRSSTRDGRPPARPTTSPRPHGETQNDSTSRTGPTAAPGSSCPSDATRSNV